MSTPTPSIANVTTAQAPAVRPVAAPAADAAQATTQASRDQWHSRARRVITGTDGGAAGALSAEQLMTDVKVGVAISAPMEVVFNSQAYRKGQINSSQYTARIIANSLGFGTWTIGGAVAAALLAPLGLPAFGVAVAGFAAGMIANDLWDRTFGAAIIKVLGDRLPQKITKPFANVVTKYFANPLYDHVWSPIKHLVWGHKVLSGVLLGAAALRFPMAAKAIGREAGVWIGGTVAALGVQWGITNRILPQAPQIPSAPAGSQDASAADAETLKTLQDAYTTALGKFKAAGATPDQADAAAQKWMVDTLCQNGATKQDALAVVKVAVDDLKAKQAKAPAPAPAKKAA